jgi:hypothetical protein
MLLSVFWHVRGATGSAHRAASPMYLSLSECARARVCVCVGACLRITQGTCINTDGLETSEKTLGRDVLMGLFRKTLHLEPRSLTLQPLLLFIKLCMSQLPLT